MNIMELGAVGELVGGVAVIATLVYLAAQVRQVRQMSRVAAFDKNAESWNEVCRAALDNFDIFCRGTEAGYGYLDPREKLRFNFVMNQVFGYLENFHQKFRHGVIDRME